MQNMRTITEETRDPKYSHIERERRWLVDPKLRPALDVLPYTRIEDRYISGTRLRLRRMTSSASSEQSLKLTKKYKCPDPLARPMVTAYLTQEEYKLFSNLEALPLAKRRYQVDGFSIDIFEGELTGLELAEIECSNDAELRALVDPAWVVADVSDDPNYAGGRLASEGNKKEKTWRNS